MLRQLEWTVVAADRAPGKRYGDCAMHQSPCTPPSQQAACPWCALSYRASPAGLALVIGLAGAVDTFAAQAFGASRHGLLGVVLQRALLINLAASVAPILLWALGGERLLWWAGEPRMAAAAMRYARLWSPVLVLHGSSQCIYRYLVAQGTGSWVLYGRCLTECSPYLWPPALRACGLACSCLPLSPVQLMYCIFVSCLPPRPDQALLQAWPSPSWRRARCAALPRCPSTGCSSSGWAGACMVPLLRRSALRPPTWRCCWPLPWCSAQRHLLKSGEAQCSGARCLGVHTRHSRAQHCGAGGVLWALMFGLCCTACCCRPLTGFSKEALKGWGAHLSIAVPAAAMVAVEWLVFDLVNLIAGWLLRGVRESLP